MSDASNPTEFPKAYDPKHWEPSILSRWDEENLASPETCIAKGVTRKEATPFSIVLPPPNVTGTLHIGHAAMLASRRPPPRARPVLPIVAAKNRTRISACGAQTGRTVARQTGAEMGDVAYEPTG